jgi:hypothetical protein
MAEHHRGEHPAGVTAPTGEPNPGGLEGTATAGKNTDLSTARGDTGSWSK